MGIVRIRLNYINQGQQMHNVLHYKFDDNEVRDYQIAADYIRDAWVLSLQNRVADDCSLDNITYNELAVQSVDTDVEFTAGAASGSAGASNSTVSQLACLIRTIGTVPFKPNRGRIYLTGLATDQLSDGRWTTQAQGGVSNWATAMKTVPAGGPSGLALVIYSPTNVAKGVGLVSNDVSAFSVQRTVATQRRRRLGVGQ